MSGNLLAGITLAGRGTPTAGVGVLRGGRGSGRARPYALSTACSHALGVSIPAWAWGGSSNCSAACTSSVVTPVGRRIFP